MLCPVWSPNKRVGEILWEPCGLYWQYSSRISGEFSGFVRLYLHTGGLKHVLGVFEPEDGSLTLSGRISARSLGDINSSYVFSVFPEPYLPAEALENVPPLPFGAMRRSDGWEYCIPIEKINESVLSYFCFFRTAVLDNRSCVLLTQDREGMPYLPEISP